MFEHSAAEEVQEKPLAVKSNGYRIGCRHLVMATHIR